MSIRDRIMDGIATTTRGAMTKGPRGTGRVIAPLIRALYRGSDAGVRPMTGSVEIDNRLRLHIRIDTSIKYERTLYFLGPKYFDPEVRVLIPRLLRPGRSAIDVGANIGLHTVVMAAAAGRGRVIACEPLGAVAHRLRANLTTNHLTNVEVVEMAISDRSGPMNLLVPASGGIVQPYASAVPNMDYLYEARSLVVRSTTVDSLVEHYQVTHLDLIKIDVEGFEGAVLMGALQTLATQQPVIIAEHTPIWWRTAGIDGQELRRELRKIGYEDIFVLDRNRGPKRIDDNSPLPMGNLMIVPRSRADVVGMARIPTHKGHERSERAN